MDARVRVTLPEVMSEELGVYVAVRSDEEENVPVPLLLHWPVLPPAVTEPDMVTVDPWQIN